MSMTAPLARATPAFTPSHTAGGRVLARLGQVAVVVLACAAAFIVVWGAMYTAQPGGGLRTGNAQPITTLSSEQLLSQWRAGHGLAVSSAAGRLLSGSMTPVPVPLAQPQKG